MPPDNQVPDGRSHGATWKDIIVEGFWVVRDVLNDWRALLTIVIAFLLLNLEDVGPLISEHIGPAVAGVFRAIKGG